MMERSGCTLKSLTQPLPPPSLPARMSHIPLPPSHCTSPLLLSLVLMGGVFAFGEHMQRLATAPEASLHLPAALVSTTYGTHHDPCAAPWILVLLPVEGRKAWTAVWDWDVNSVERNGILISHSYVPFICHH